MYTEPNISITPSRISSYIRVLNNDGSTFRRPKSSYKLPTSNQHNGNVSKRSARRLRDKINWLTFIAKKQKVTYPNGTVSHNFRLSFITLTLPSKQRHSDIEIKRVFNNFLTTLRKRYGLKHYVWKAELQKNNNIHFHLTTTLFINHQVVRTLWNNAINRLGYVDAYRKRFSQMSYDVYRQVYGANMRKHGKDFDPVRCQKSYDDGQKNGWTQPNSTDIKTVFRVKDLAAYLAKYLAKELSKDGNEKRIENFGGNIWFCSRSLSRLTSYTDLMCNQWADVRDFIANLKGSMALSFDFCECVYYSLRQLPDRIRSSIERILNRYVSRCISDLDPSYSLA